MMPDTEEWYNHEHYRDMTAALALRALEREEALKKRAGRKDHHVGIHRAAEGRGTRGREYEKQPIQTRHGL